MKNSYLFEQTYGRDWKIISKEIHPSVPALPKSFYLSSTEPLVIEFLMSRKIRLLQTCIQYIENTNAQASNRMSRMCEIKDFEIKASKRVISCGIAFV